MIHDGRKCEHSTRDWIVDKPKRSKGQKHKVFCVVTHIRFVVCGIVLSGHQQHGVTTAFNTGDDMNNGLFLRFHSLRLVSVSVSVSRPECDCVCVSVYINIQKAQNSSTVYGLAFPISIFPFGYPEIIYIVETG